MGNLNEWLCACEKTRGVGNKCAECQSAILNNFSNHRCTYAYNQCQKKTGWW